MQDHSGQLFLRCRTAQIVFYHWKEVHLLHVVKNLALGEELLLNHRDNRLNKAVTATRQQRCMIGKSERLPKDRRYCKPVRNPADQCRFTYCEQRTHPERIRKSDMKEKSTQKEDCREQQCGICFIPRTH